MPLNQTAFLRSSALMLMIGFVALAIIVGTTVWLINRAQHYFDDMLNARDLRANTINLRVALQQVESAQRGYIITGDETYLGPFDTSRDRVMPLYEILKADVAEIGRASCREKGRSGK